MLPLIALLAYSNRLDLKSGVISLISIKSNASVMLISSKHAVELHSTLQEHYYRIVPAVFRIGGTVTKAPIFLAMEAVFIVSMYAQYMVSLLPIIRNKFGTISI